MSGDSLMILVLASIFLLVFSIGCFLVLIYEVRLNAKRDKFFRTQMGQLLNQITDLINQIKK